MWTDMIRPKLRILLAVTFLLTCAAATSNAGDKTDKEKKPLSGYSTLLVEKFTVEKNAATEELPGGQEVVMQKSSIARLREKKAFPTIVDLSEPQEQQTLDTGKHLQLAGTVVVYDKGSRAARWFVGFGAGAAKVKVRFVFKDADTGEVLFSVDRQGKYYGFIGLVGGSQEQATSEAAGDVVDGLIKEIEKRR